ncbi:MAG: hypothetical protein LBB61_00505 [Treponema sp.]|nr:hypothetical protein [Treponema sp.]
MIYCLTGGRSRRFTGYFHIIETKPMGQLRNTLLDNSPPLNREAMTGICAEEYAGEFVIDRRWLPL